MIDTNIVIAAIDGGHEAHGAALELLGRMPGEQPLFAAHSVAEAYSTLTKLSGPNPIAMTGDEACRALASVRAKVRIVGLTAEQTIAAVERFSALGIGPRLYDYLIGETGIANGARVIVTLNLRHMRSLFHELPVLSPDEYLRQSE